MEQAEEWVSLEWVSLGSGRSDRGDICSGLEKIFSVLSMVGWVDKLVCWLVFVPLGYLVNVTGASI